WKILSNNLSTEDNALFNLNRIITVKSTFSTLSGPEWKGYSDLRKLVKIPLKLHSKKRLFSFRKKNRISGKSCSDSSK
ncbi:hypothetical protein NPIL_352101, partial [Nephila pilipes]